MRKVLFAFAIAGMLSTAALAGPIDEVEPNDSFDEAQVLPDDFFEPFGAGSVHGFLAADDVDYFLVNLIEGKLATASIFDFTPGDNFDNDSLLGVFAPDGTLFAVDDDGGPGFLSSIAFFPTESGAWAFAVSGFGDDDFDGSHGEAFEYRLVLSIPEPTTFGLMLVGAALVARKRRS